MLEWGHYALECRDQPVHRRCIGVRNRKFSSWLGGGGGEREEIWGCWNV